MEFQKNIKSQLFSDYLSCLAVISQMKNEFMKITTFFSLFNRKALAGMFVARLKKEKIRQHEPVTTQMTGEIEKLQTFLFSSFHAF